MSPEIEGRVVWRGDDDYEALRLSMVWNDRKPDRYPEAIVTVASADDVVAAVALARARSLQVAVRAGGHSWVGASLRDGSLLIDLSALDGIEIDADARTASLGPAVKGARLAEELERHGLAFPVGHCPSVAISGFLLSGGFGWNSGAWGPACMSLVGIDVVTPAGELVHADENHNPELLWAARGAGPGFPGVVTRFHVALHDLPRAITTSTYVYDLEDLEEVAEWATQITEVLPPSVELTLLLAPAPDGVPVAPHGKALVVTATAFEDSDEAAAAALAALETSPALGRVLTSTVGEPSPFPVLFRDFGGRWPEGRRYVADNAWAQTDFTGALVGLRDAVVAAPAAESFVFAGVGPAPPEEPAADEMELPDMAFSMTARAFIAAYGIWSDPSDDEANAEWLASVMRELEPLAVGHYLAEADLDAAGTRTARSFAQENWERLEDLRGRVDPERRFATYPAAG